MSRPAPWRDLRFERPVVIAEIGGNHEGSTERAFELLELAASHGADVVKFQTYSAASLVNPRLAPDRFEHFRRFELDDETWHALATRAHELGVHWMTSLWDIERVDELAPLVVGWKVGSGDLTHRQMLERLLRTGLPVIVSIAMTEGREVDELVAFVSDVDHDALRAGRFALLQCTAMYDTPRSDMVDLAVMGAIRERHPDVVVGYSDHDLGVQTAKFAVAAGASIVEVHFTDDTTRAFRDHRLSVTPAELRELRDWCELAPVVRGSPRKEVRDLERENRVTFRRAIYPRRSLTAGTTITADDVVALRPAHGIDASRWHEVIGRRLTRDVEAMEPLSEDDLA